MKKRGRPSKPKEPPEPRRSYVNAQELYTHCANCGAFERVRNLPKPPVTWYSYRCRCGVEVRVDWGGYVNQWGTSPS